MAFHLIFFKALRGLKQEDLLLPYIFMLAMETLSHLVKMAKEGGFLSGFRVRDKGGARVEVSLLLFVVDPIFFCKTSLNQMTYLSRFYVV